MQAHRTRFLPSRGALQLVAAWLAWWSALAAVWLLLVDTFDGQELFAGAVAASVAASVAVAVHRRGYISFWPKARWALELPYVLGAVVVDCGLLGQALWRRLIRRERYGGTMIRVPFHHGGNNGRDGARRALVNFAVSLTPNTYVVDIDPESDSLLVHRLVPCPIDRVLRREEARSAQTTAPNDDGAGS